MIKVCIVGLGTHAKTKIIPAIKSIKNSELAVVTSQKDFHDINIKKFETLNEAMSNLEKNFYFYISTPPSLHFEIARNLITNKFNCLIEKPIFLNSNELNEIIAIANYNSTYFYECFMYKHGKIYFEFINKFSEERNKIESLEINFCIPKIPDKTFRSDKNIKSSLIYDMGCYPISLINQISNKKNIKLISVDNYGNMGEEKFYVEGNIEDIDLKITFGVDKNYENYITINSKNGEKIKFEHFFYGRKSEKKIINTVSTKERIRNISDGNLFKKMLEKIGNNLSKTQNCRNKGMKRNIIDLESLITDYVNLSI